MTVIIATYNWSSVLRYAIHTTLWQTYKNIELLVIGDACTDDSEQVVDSFADPRVRWHNLPENRGNQFGPNNAGLGLARGEYVALPRPRRCLVPDSSCLAHEGGDRNGRVACTHAHRMDRPRRQLLRLRLRRDTALCDPPRNGARPGDRLARLPRTRREARPRLHTSSDRAVGNALNTCADRLQVPVGLAQEQLYREALARAGSYVRRIECERDFIDNELAALRNEAWPGFALDEDLPNPVPQAWLVTQFRKVRGLE